MTALAEEAPETAAEQFFAGVAMTRPADASARGTTPHPTSTAATRAIVATADGVGAADPHRGAPGRSRPARWAEPRAGSSGDPDRVASSDRDRDRDRASSGGADRASSGYAVRPAADARPRVRLVPALPPARPRTASTPPAGPPPTLAERIRVLRVDDHSLDPDEVDELRGAAPEVDPSLVARRLAGATVEVIAGRRPVAQLARWLAPGVLDALRARAAITRHSATPTPSCAPTVRGVRVCALHEHLVEATAVVDDGRRVRAIALRLETHRGSWRATALEVG